MGKVTNGRDARVRASLASDLPILGARCRDAQARLFDFSVQVRVIGGHFDETGLTDAAEVLLEHAQSALRNGTSPLSPEAAYELARARQWAIYALELVTGSHAHAQRHELAVTNGTPLTVCIGVSPFAPPVLGADKLRTIRTIAGDVHIPAPGCFAIIPESTSLGGRWRLWCEKCAPNRGKRARSLERKHRRVVEAWALNRLGN